MRVGNHEFEVIGVQDRRGKLADEDLDNRLSGLIAGIAATRSIATIAGWETRIGAPSLVVSFLVALAVGLFLGYHPARRASRLDPLVALRYV